MTEAAEGEGCGRYEGVIRQMLELGHAQVSDGDEVLDVAETPGGGLRLLQRHEGQTRFRATLDARR